MGSYAKVVFRFPRCTIYIIDFLSVYPVLSFSKPLRASGNREYT